MAADRNSQRLVSKFSQGWRADVQGMRSLAILAVVAYHSGLPLPGGFVGVDLFFVISGFVITGMLLRRKQQGQGLHVANFYLNRFKRLSPALLVMVIVVLLIGVSFTSPIDVQTNAALTGIGAVFLSANFVAQATSGSYFSPAAELNPLLHVWSLSLEEQYYLIFPIVLISGWWINRRLQLVGPALLTFALFLVSLFLALFGLHIFTTVNPVIFGFYSPLVRVWEFAAGALLAFAGTRLPRPPLILASAAGFTGLLLFGFSVFFVDAAVQFPGPWTLAPVGAGLLLIWAGFNADNPITRFLSTRTMVYIGDRSYSWYLWHWPIIVFAFAIFPNVPLVGIWALAISIFPTLVSYRYVEQWSRYGQWSRPRSLLTLSVLSITALAAAGFVLLGTSQAWWNAKIVEAREQLLQDHAANRLGCHVYLAPNTDDYQNCWLSTDGAGKPIVLVGDSNADHFSDGFLFAARALARPLLAISASSCPFVGSDESVDTRCRDYIDRTMYWLERQPPSTVVISTTGSNYTESNGAELAETIGILNEMGHEVVVVQPIPRIVTGSTWRGAWDPSSCTALALARGECGTRLQIEDSSDDQQLTWSTVRRVADTTGAQVIDLNSEVCPGGTCLTYSDNRWIYQDFNHISAPESRRLGPVIAQKLDGKQVR